MVWLLLVGLAPTERPVAGYVSSEPFAPDAGVSQAGQRVSAGRVAAPPQLYAYVCVCTRLYAVKYLKNNKKMLIWILV
jgi:hypothetical protein